MSDGLRDGRAAVRWLSLAVAGVIVIGLVVLQQMSSPSLERATVEQEIASTITSEIEPLNDINLVLVDTMFTRPDLPGQNTAIIDLIVQIADARDTEAAETLIGGRIEELVESSYDVTALVTVHAFTR